MSRQRPTAKTSSGPSEAIDVFDRDGDLRFEVGDTKKILLVNSHTVALASDVFKAMLFGPYLERKPEDGVWVVSLPQDDADSLTIILNIVHLRFNLIPEKLHFNELFQLTVLTNKYDLTHVLQPWAKAWCDDISNHIEVGKHDLEMLVWIAWELGIKSLFENILKYLSWECGVNSKSSLAIQDSELQCTGYLDVIDIPDIVKEGRLLFIGKLLETLRDCISKYLDGQVQQLCEWQTYNITETCESAFLGAIIMRCSGSNLYPIPDKEDYRQASAFYRQSSAADLWVGLRRTASTVGNVRLGLIKPNDHDDCHLLEWMLYELDLDAYWQENLGDLIPQAHSDHLIAQAKKTGMEDYEDLSPCWQYSFPAWDEYDQSI